MECVVKLPDDVNSRFECLGFVRRGNELVVPEFSEKGLTSLGDVKMHGGLASLILEFLPAR
jgi:hypothetical protein